MNEHVQEVAVIDQAAAVRRIQERSEASSLMSAIDRAARDPSVDIEKFERLVTMKERAEARIAEVAFNAAMRAAQSEMRIIGTDATNPQTRSRYATYAKLDTALRPIYTRHGFSLSFDEADSPKPDHIRILCYVGHDVGHMRTYRKDMPADGKGAKGGDVMTKTHATGAAGSYGARYLLRGIFNVAVGEEDRDGNQPSDTRDPGPISEAQLVELRDLMDSCGADVPKFCVAMSIDGLALLPAGRFDEAIRRIREYAAEKRRRERQKPEGRS